MARHTMSDGAAPRRRARGLLLAPSAAVAVLILAACGSGGGASAGGGSGSASGSATSAPTQVTTTVAPSIATAPLQMAVAKKYFAANNIDLNVAPTTPPSQTIQLLTGGKLDIAFASPGAALNNAVLGGADVVMLGSAAAIPTDTKKPNAGLLVSAAAWNAGVHSLADLKGKTINITPSLQSASGLAVAKLLEKGGLKLSDVKTQDWTDQTQLVPAFEAGSADVAWMLEPALTAEQKQHGAHLLGSASEVTGGQPALAILANKSWVQSHQQATVNFLKAWLQGVKYVNDGLSSNWAKNADTLDVLAKATGMSVDLLKTTPFSAYPPDGKVNPNDIKQLVEFSQQLGAVKTVVDPNKYIDQSYVTKAAG